MAFTVPVQFDSNTLAVSADVDKNFDAIAQWLNAFGYVLGLPTGGDDTPMLAAALAALADHGGGIDAQPDATGAGCGGRLVIPQYQYEVTAAVGGSAIIASQTLIEAGGYGGSVSGGGGNGKPFYHFMINGSGASGEQGLVLFRFVGDHTSGGGKLYRCAFSWKGGTNSTDQAMCLAFWNAIAEECSFYDVPVIASFGQLPDGGIKAQSGNGCELRRPVSRYGYGANPIDYVTHIWMSGEQGYIRGPGEILMNSVQNTGFKSAVGCSVGGGVLGNEHQIIEGVHIVDWNYAIDFADINNVGIASGCQHTTIRDCQLVAWCIAVNCAPHSPGGVIYDQKYALNVMTKAQSSIDGSPIAVVDVNNGPNSAVSGILFLGNMIYSNVTDHMPEKNGIAQSHQYGIQINGGGSVVVMGNTIGSIGGNNPAVVGCAAIAITSEYTPPYNGGFNADGSPHPGYPTIKGRPPINGSPVKSNGGGTPIGAAHILIEGNILRPLYAGVYGNNPTGPNGSGPSDYAIIISGTQAGNIQIRGNDMTGYPTATGPLLVTATITGTLEVADNQGYNDQQTPIIPAGVPGAVPQAAGISASNAATLNGGGVTGCINYWGPSQLRFSNGNATGTVTLHIGSDSYVIPPGAYVDRYIKLNTDHWYITVAGGATIANLVNNPANPLRWIGK